MLENMFRSKLNEQHALPMLSLKAYLEGILRIIFRKHSLPYVTGKPQIIHHEIAASKNVGSKNVTENCIHKSLSIIQPNYFFKDKRLKNKLEKDNEKLKLQLQ